MPSSAEVFYIKRVIRLDLEVSKAKDSPSIRSYSKFNYKVVLIGLFPIAISY